MKKISKTPTCDALKELIPDDHILECVIMFSNRKMEAARSLQFRLHGKWNITTLEAVELLKKLTEEL